MTKQTLKALPAKITDDMVISQLVKDNPKRGKCAGAFALYKPGMTVAAYKTAYVGYKKSPGAVKCPALNHIKWDFQRGFIDLAAAKTK